ncbi:MAG: hypothetical protein IJN07_01090 [Clostridia bacterium]|nr:hypothetical protein [Clostridia bacterium]
MKRILCCLICLVILFLFVGCNSNTTPVLSGVYYAEGDYKEGLTPYVSLSLDDNTFSMGAGSLFSFAVNGSFVIEKDTLVATTQSATFVFDITDSNTLVLVDNGDNEFFQPAENSEFVYSENLK